MSAAIWPYAAVPSGANSGAWWNALTGSWWYWKSSEDKTARQKQAIIDRLDFLAHQGLSGVHPYLRTSDARHIIQIEGRFWQASPYVPGMPLDRPGYAFDGWRARPWQIFWSTSGKPHETFRTASPPCLFRFWAILMRSSGRSNFGSLDWLKNLRQSRPFLKNAWRDVHGLLPVAFCHGDYHPLNMIWSETDMQGVIDWEFSGTKPENYDAAILIGCMGMETPDALTGPLVTEFIR